MDFTDEFSSSRAFFWSLGCVTTMVKRSSLASRLPAQKVKPCGEVAQFPILENEEGSEAIYWNPPSAAALPAASSCKH